MRTSLLLFMAVVISVAMLYCTAQTDNKEDVFPPSEILKQEPQKAYEQFFKTHPELVAEGFDYPVGKPEARGYYNAQGFGENNHLGDDWNGTGGGNSDLGDPVYAIANGFISEACDAGGGWGNIVRIIHKTSDSTYVESLYAHLDSIHVSALDSIRTGAQIGTIGNANGAYLAHLHLEVRDSVEMPLGGGYSTQTLGYLDPTDFINTHRKVMWRRVVK